MMVMIGSVTNISKGLQWNQIDKISTLNDVEFCDQGIIVRRYSNVGCGKLIKLEERRQSATYDFSILTGKDSIVKYDCNIDPSLCIPSNAKKIPSKQKGFRTDKKKPEGVSSGHGILKESNLWECKVDLCQRKYLRKNDLMQHMANGEHSIPIKTESSGK